MQDRDKDVDDAEEAFAAVKVDTDSAAPDATPDAKKDGKFAFRRMKQPKKDKNSPSRFQGEGVTFKAKLIGVESVPDARGDKMCQDAMHKLKQNVRNAGPHKRKINVCVSLQGIKIKDEKNGSLIYHHPVGLISFISQDITDARAFGYVVGSTGEPHQFIAIKTEKPAFHVVLAIRDLFQTVLNHKREVIDTAKEKESKTENQKIEEAEHKMKEIAEVTNKPFEEQKATEENIYFEVLLTEPLKMKEEEERAAETEPVQTVDDLLGLQNELNKLQEGIDQMDTSIAAVAAFNSEVTPPENDPFDTSFVLGPKRDSIPFPMPTPVPVTSTLPSTENVQPVGSPSCNAEDKYAVFSAIDSEPSIFETVPQECDGSEIVDQEETREMTPPAKPPRSSKTNSPDLSVFADLDPLGKDRPYKDKTEFFQDVKNPPKKVLNDLVDPNKDSQRAFGATLLPPSVAPFPVEFESNKTFPNPAASSSLPNSFHSYPHLSVPPLQNGNGDAQNNPFEKQESTPPPKALSSRASEPGFHSENGHTNIMNAAYLGKSPPSGAILGTKQQLTVSSTLSSQNVSSSPIPIPPRQTAFGKERSFSSGSAGSPYSKSPSYIPESPNNTDYYLQNQSDYYSPNALHIKNALPNGDNLPTISPPTMNANRSTHHSNGVSRPRPRPSLSKGSSSGHSNSSHSLSSDSSSDYEAISRESMQCIANVLLTNGHRLRAQSLCLENNKHFSIGGDKNIFTKKNDPFADDFFFSLPKKAMNTEIPEYM